MRSVNLILLLSVHYIKAAQDKINPECDMSQCNGYYKLIPHKIKKPNIEVTKTQIKITESVPDIEVAYAKRRWLTIYCYDGSAMDPNTGCDEAIEIRNPSCAELRQWVNYGMCPTGWECRPDGECTGYTANTRCFDSSTTVTNKGPTTLKWEGARYMLFPMHTCVSSWECNTIKTRLDIFAKVAENNELGWVVYDKDNKEHQITESFYNDGDNSENGEKFCLTHPIKSPKVSIEDASCYAESENNIKCIVQGNGSNKGTVYDISKAGEGVMRNTKAEIIGPLMVPKDGRIIDLNGDKSNKYNTLPNHLLNRQRAVNVETAHELAIGANILQMQSLYNIISLAQEVDEIYNALIHIVKSQSIDDPQLISRILSKSNFAVKWSNNEIFEKCNCIEDVPLTDSNCKDGKMFSYGSYIGNIDNSRCYHIPQDNIQEISLVNATAIKADFIKYLPPQTASSDSASWDALNDYRNKMISGDKSSHSYENLDQKISKIEEKLGLNTFNKIFVYSSYAAAWLSLLILIIRCRSN